MVLFEVEKEKEPSLAPLDDEVEEIVNEGKSCRFYIQCTNVHIHIYN